MSEATIHQPSQEQTDALNTIFKTDSSGIYTDEAKEALGKVVMCPDTEGNPRQASHEDMLAFLEALQKAIDNGDYVIGARGNIVHQSVGANSLGSLVIDSIIGPGTTIGECSKVGDAWV